MKPSPPSSHGRRPPVRRNVRSLSAPQPRLPRLAAIAPKNDTRLSSSAACAGSTATARNGTSICSNGMNAIYIPRFAIK